MSDINYGEILEALNDKCDRDMGNSEKPYITETYSNGTSWYRVWSDNWCEQGGIETPTGTTNQNVTFLKPFINTNYSVITDISATTNSSFDRPQSYYKNTGNFQTTGFSYSTRDTTYKFIWEAKGYIA